MTTKSQAERARELAGALRAAYPVAFSDGPVSDAIAFLDSLNRPAEPHRGAVAVSDAELMVLREWLSACCWEPDLEPKRAMVLAALGQAQAAQQRIEGALRAIEHYEIGEFGSSANPNITLDRIKEELTK